MFNFRHSLTQGFTLNHILAMPLRTLVVHSPWTHPGLGGWERGWFLLRASSLNPVTGQICAQVPSLSLEPGFGSITGTLQEGTCHLKNRCSSIQRGERDALRPAPGKPIGVYLPKTLKPEN